MIVAVPAAMPVTVIVALDVPDGTVRGVCTAATAGLLLDMTTVTAVDVVAFRLTVACTVLPAVAVVALSATADTVATIVVGTVGEFELHCAAVNAATSVNTNLGNAVARWLTFTASLRSQIVHMPASDN